MAQISWIPTLPLRIRPIALWTVPCEQLIEKETWAWFRDGFHDTRHPAKVDCCSLTSPKQSIPEILREEKLSQKAQLWSEHFLVHFIFIEKWSKLWIYTESWAKADGYVGRSRTWKTPALEEKVPGGLGRKNTMVLSGVAQCVYTFFHPLQKSLSIIQWTKITHQVNKLDVSELLSHQPLQCFLDRQTRSGRSGSNRGYEWTQQQGLLTKAKLAAPNNEHLACQQQKPALSDQNSNIPPKDQTATWWILSMEEDTHTYTHTHTYVCTQVIYFSSLHLFLSFSVRTGHSG